MHELVLVLWLLVQCDVCEPGFPARALVTDSHGVTTFGSHGECITWAMALMDADPEITGYVCEVKPQRPGLKSVGL